MPETGFGEPITSLAIDVKEEVERGRRDFLSDRKVLDLVAKHNLEAEHLGNGAECVVVGMDKKSPQGKELAAAFTYKDMPPIKMKRIFYAQRVMSTLFPRNFPRFYAAFGKHPRRESDKNVSGTIREKAIANPIKRNGQRLNRAPPQGQISFF